MAGFGQLRLEASDKEQARLDTEWASKHEKKHEECEEQGQEQLQGCEGPDQGQSETQDTQGEYSGRL